MKHRELLQATGLLRQGMWDDAHRIVQYREDSLACWIHALLHKIEPDEGNSRYWYARTSHSYHDFAATEQELQAIEDALNTGKLSE
ncbi:MAG: hypothetical protein RIQ52_2086 [Pseudomonadota bacterium]